MLMKLNEGEQRSEVYSEVGGEPKDKIATIEREFKLRKRMALSVLGNLITVSSAVNNLGLIFFCKMCD